MGAVVSFEAREFLAEPTRNASSNAGSGPAPHAADPIGEG